MGQRRSIIDVLMSKKKNVLKSVVRSATAGLLTFLAIALTASAAAAGPNAAPAADSGPGFKDKNLSRLRRFLAETSAPGNRLDDYYFVLIGDIQNSVRDLGHPVFNVIAKDIQGAVDEKTGERLYDKIRFVILLGDLVYEGPSARQWESLERAFAGRGPDGTTYPYIELLARDKPIFPALGNHEILSFRPYPQNRYKDLFDSPLGAARFKAFFAWDRLIADPHIFYPVPADLPEDIFRELTAKLPEPADRQTLAENYVLKDDGRYHLKFYENPSLREAEFRAGRDTLAAELSALFRKAGYGTLPVLNSDNMVCYAFEAGNVVYLFLDSMARGWHYPVFSRLKKTLYPIKKDQHRLNLFTLSPYNGQTDFYRAVAAYAREHGKTLIPMMHHSIFNKFRDPYSRGVEYNSWLALGFPQAPEEKGDPTLMDDILFSNAPVTFSACVHRFETFSIVAKTPGQPDHALRWYVSGGGGGPFKPVDLPDRIQIRKDLYNQKLKNEAGPEAGRSIEVRDAEGRYGNHYLIVHVRNGEVIDVSPRFIDPKDLHRPLFRPRVALASAYYSSPGSAGASLEFSPGFWGMEKFNKYLLFANWRPSLSLGFVSYNVWEKNQEVQTNALALEISPFTLECHLPRANIVTLRLLGLEWWDGRANLRRAFLTTGAEMPLFYNLSGHLENLNVGIKVYFPLHSGASADPNFGQRIKLAFTVGCRFKL
jgi:hypothetical protein